MEIFQINVFLKFRPGFLLRTEDTSGWHSKLDKNSGNSFYNYIFFETPHTQEIVHSPVGDPLLK